MRPVVVLPRFASSGAPAEFDPSGSAKQELTDEIGTFCSFCGKYNSRSALHVEHIRGKKCKDAADNYIYDHLKFRWDNFLLACINCNSVKGNKDVVALNSFLPNINNLLHFVDILSGGLIEVKNSVTGENLARTRAFIDLVGLDRVPGHPRHSPKDDRWDNRLKAYDLALRHLHKYTAEVRTTDIETIIDLAGKTGFFCVWYSVFNLHFEVKEALVKGTTDSSGNLIIAFPGTHQESFNGIDNYSTLPRPNE
jgi:hypothetical protein